MSSVIVFGATGQIGSVAALTAAEQGAKVWLALRNPDKPIPGLSKEKEAAGNFHRVQADLEDAESVRRAVQTSGAQRALLYLAHHSSDHMKATFEALKAEGITFLVFVSSFTIHLDKGLRDIPAWDVIPHVHAQAEANLNDIYGEDAYVALRPGAFASNLLRHQKALVQGTVPLYGGDFPQDNISPSDIGRVGGTILVSGPRNSQKKVYLYGPKVRSIHDSLLQIGELLGKSIQITSLTRDEAYHGYLQSGMPEHFAKYMVDVLHDAGDKKDIFPHYDEGVQNVQLYTGKPSMSLEQWVKENEATLTAA